MGNPKFRREAVRSLEYMVPECRYDLNSIVHDADLPFPDYLKDINFHLIILGPTFLCNRHDKSNLNRTKQEYDFIRTSNACKIALPQDDYDCSGILDKWMVDWNIDFIYTVCPNKWDILYPSAIKKSQIKLGYTGYISKEWIANWANPKPHHLRNIDVSYRARKLSPNFGSLGQLKWEIADNFKIEVSKHADLNLDISTSDKDLIAGSKWHEFIENSKFCLTTASGSSLIDPWNHIRNCVNVYCAKFPEAKFEEIENHCFPNQDRKLLFTALSPRNIEAALAKTVQIATPGSYSGLMDEKAHFIPLNENCSNVSEVLEMMNDRALVLKIQESCKESILSEFRLRRENIVNEMVLLAESVINKRNLGMSNQEIVDKKFKKYKAEIITISNRVWKRKQIEHKIKSVAVGLGFRRLKYLLSHNIK
jgi:hypothetical protein